jgi:hypothetical protein
MAAQGITAGSVIGNQGERGINDAYGTARDKAILAGTTEYGNVFNRGLQARQQAASEAQTGYQAALQGLTGLGSVRSSLDPNKWNADTKASAAFLPQTIYGAAQDTFSANRQNENADIAQSNANRAATASNINTGLNAVGGLSGLGSAASGLWDWGKKNLFGGGTQGTLGQDYLTNDYGWGTNTNAMDAFMQYGTSGD